MSLLLVQDTSSHKESPLTHLIDKIGLGFVGRRRGHDVPVLAGAEGSRVAPPLPGRGRGLGRYHVPQRVIQVAVQQAALVLGGRRRRVVAVAGVGHGENAVLLLQSAFVGRPGEIRLADGRLDGTLLLCDTGNRTVT